MGIDDALGHISWTRNFMLSQGHVITDNIIYQDNDYAILLEINGRSSSTKRTKHMNIHFFLVKDRLDKEEMSIDHCGTNDMTGGFSEGQFRGNNVTSSN